MDGIALVVHTKRIQLTRFRLVLEQCLGLSRISPTLHHRLENGIPVIPLGLEIFEELLLIVLHTTAGNLSGGNYESKPAPMVLRLDLSKLSKFSTQTLKKKPPEGSEAVC